MQFTQIETSYGDWLCSDMDGARTWMMRGLDTGRFDEVEELAEHGCTSAQVERITAGCERLVEAAESATQVLRLDRIISNPHGGEGPISEWRTADGEAWWLTCEYLAQISDYLPEGSGTPYEVRATGDHAKPVGIFVHTKLVVILMPLRPLDT
jgi:hypothetical protein